MRAAIPRFTPAVWFVFAGYILLLAYFQKVDVYHQHFFMTGKKVCVYHLFRLAFIVYSCWLYYALGYFIFRIFHVSRPEYTLTSLLLTFFTGVGSANTLFLFIGLAGYYTRPFLEIATLCLFVYSLPELSRCLRQVTLINKTNAVLGSSILLLPLGAFLLVKGLYPAGGHDYYQHYFHYYKRVIETGSILPNEVWYHFYYCKGAGLFFASMLLTDPLAPQLATLTLMLGAAGVMYLLIQQHSHSKLLAWLAVAMYFAFLIYTPGPVENMHHGGWGDMEKTHEPAAVLLFASIWLVIGIIETQGARIWNITLAFVLSALVIISPTMSIYPLGFLSSLFLFTYTLRKPYCAVVGFNIALIGFWLAVILGVNFYFTGLLDDHLLLTSWQWINFEKIMQWGVLFELLQIHMGATGQVAYAVPLSSNFIFNLSNYLRLDLWGYLLGLAGLLAILHCFYRLIKPSTPKSTTTSVLITGLFLCVTILISLKIGRDQPISYYRFTTFAYAPMLCFCFLLLPRPFYFLNIAAVIAGSYFAYQVYYMDGKLQQIIHNAKHFSSGHFSIADAYHNQQGWPGRLPWGGINPAIENVWHLLPKNTRIWSMHVHSYCMLPDCRVESFQSYRLSRYPAEVYYGSADEEKKIFQTEYLNYFFFSTQLGVTDVLHFSPLFTPEHIANYLGIAWTDGDNTLLTWKENAIKPIDKAWVERYKLALQQGTFADDALFNQFRKIIEVIQKDKTMDQKAIPWYHAGWK